MLHHVKLICSVFCTYQHNYRRFLECFQLNLCKKTSCELVGLHVHAALRWKTDARLQWEL